MAWSAPDVQRARRRRKDAPQRALPEHDRVEFAAETQIVNGADRAA